MPAEDIRYKSRVISPRKALTAPDWDAETVLVADPWEYVDLWLRREQHLDARNYWKQAREFAEATDALPPTSAPLTAYYCFLNATKALLEVRKAATSAKHGVHGKNEKGVRSLEKERVTFEGSGVLGALCRLLGEDANTIEYSLQAALYNLPYIHRAYTLTYPAATPLFISLQSPRFVKKDNSSEAWFAAAIERETLSEETGSQLPEGWELDAGVATESVVRRRKRFKWVQGGDEQTNLARLTNYHRGLRRQLYYIVGPTRLWYLKRGSPGTDYIERSTLTLTFAAMHRLSELSRYDPLSLAQHFELEHNWLLSEFIGTAPRQFIDEIASEITGRDFMVPGTRMYRK